MNLLLICSFSINSIVHCLCHSVLNSSDCLIKAQTTDKRSSFGFKIYFNFSIDDKDEKDGEKNDSEQNKDGNKKDGDKTDSEKNSCIAYNR